MGQFSLTELFKETFPFYDLLTDGEAKSLLSASQTVRFEKGKNIHDGNECTGIILIKSGALRVYLLSEDGKEITLYRLFAGDICILSASCVLGGITFDVSIDAEEACECVIVGSCAFEDIAKRLPEAKIFALECALSRFSDVVWTMEQMLFMSMDKRLAIFLLDEAAKDGSDAVHLTHDQIAKYMGSAREVVSRRLKHFISEGILAASRRDGIKILDKKRLRTIAM